MGTQTKVIGRQPTDHGPYDPNLAYGKKFVVTLFDCGWESKHDNNTTAPATLNSQTGTITPNIEHWKKRWGSYEQWLIDNGYKKVDAANVKDGNNTQHEINNAVANEIGTDSTPSSIKGRVKSLETAVGSGGSVDERIATEGARHYLKTETYTKEEVNERIATEGARHYLKTETYTKEEVNGMITTPEQGFVSVEATAQTTAATDVLPASGAADTVYRVGNWDGTQYDENVYTEYAWNGSIYVKLSTKSQIGEIYDISANHADTKYADLAAALGTNGANIPQNLRKGGMSVKFVQSSDNKYVQHMYLSDSIAVADFTNTNNWGKLECTTHKNVTKYNTANNRSIPRNGSSWPTGVTGYNIDFFQVMPEKTYHLLVPAMDNMYYAVYSFGIYNQGQTSLPSPVITGPVTEAKYDIVIPEGITSLFVCYLAASGSPVLTTIKSIESLTEKVDELEENVEEQIDELENQINYKIVKTWADFDKTHYAKSAPLDIGGVISIPYSNTNRYIKIQVYKDCPVSIKCNLNQNPNYYRMWYLTDTNYVVVALHDSIGTVENHIDNPLILTPTVDGYLYINTHSNQDEANANARIEVLTSYKDWDHKDKILDSRIDETNSRIDDIEGNIDIIIPDIVYGIIGTEINFWNDTISLSTDRGLSSPLNYQVEWISSVGIVRDRCFRFTPTATGNYQVTCIIYSSISNKEIARKTFTIKVKAKNALAVQKRTLFFGDSLGASSMQKLYANFNDSNRFSGTTPLMLGTKGEDDCKYEAFGGATWWDWATEGKTASWHVNVTGVEVIEIGAIYSDTGSHYFEVSEVNLVDGTGNIKLIKASTNKGNLVIPSGTLTKVSGEGDSSISYTGGVTDGANPVWYNGALDFTHYRTSVLGLGTNDKIDAVFCQLGINDNAAYTDTQMLDFINDMYDAFVADNPNGLFVVGLTPSSCDTQIVLTLPIYDLMNYQKKIYRFCKLYNSLLEDISRPNYRVSTQKFNLDRYYGYPFLSTVNISDRYRDKVPVHGNFAHPSESGYYQIADSLLAAYVGVLTE